MMLDTAKRVSRILLNYSYDFFQIYKPWLGNFDRLLILPELRLACCQQVVNLLCYSCLRNVAVGSGYF